MSKPAQHGPSLSSSPTREAHIPCGSHVTSPVARMSHSLWLACHIPCGSHVTSPVARMCASACVLVSVPVSHAHAGCAMHASMHVCMLVHACVPWMRARMPICARMSVCANQTTIASRYESSSIFDAYLSKKYVQEHLTEIEIAHTDWLDKIRTDQSSSDPRRLQPLRQNGRT